MSSEVAPGSQYASFKTIFEPYEHRAPDGYSADTQVFHQEKCSQVEGTNTFSKILGRQLW